MKKSILFMAFAVTAVFLSCSKDDDKKCASCSILGITIKACDNGDDTVTLTRAGVPSTISGEELSGETAANYVKAIEDNCSGN